MGIQLRFSFKFENSAEVFFAFAVPFSFEDTQVTNAPSSSEMMNMPE